MPVTRRQTGKLPPAKTVKYLILEDSDSLQASDFDDDGNGELSESIEAKRPAKRRKTAVKAGPSKAKAAHKAKGPSRRLQGRLKNMLSMPLDVLLEVFSFLSPVDLLSLARTSKDLRDFLMTRKKESIWKNARLQVAGPPVPEPPSDVSEPAWAQLLLGGTLCTDCGAKNRHYTVDFVLRRRMCLKCMRENLVTPKKFKNKCPDLDKSIMDLLPATFHTGSWYNGFRSNEGYYWRPDLYAVSDRLDDLAYNRRALEAYRAERLKLKDSTLKGRIVYETWERDAAAYERSASQDRADTRYNEIKRRLLADGFKLADIKYSYLRGSSYVNRDVTDQSWKRMQKKVEDEVRNARTKRIAMNTARIITQRSRIAEKKYTAALKTILPAQWLYLPSPYQVTSLLCFKTIIDDPVAEDEDEDEGDEGDPDYFATIYHLQSIQNGDHPSNPDAWASASSALPQQLSDWMREKRAAYIALPPAADYPSGPMHVTLLDDPAADAVRSEQMATYGGALELASSVFTPNGRDALVGRDIFRSWKSTHRELPRFSLPGHQAAIALVEALALSPKSTTAVELDRLDRRFLCMCCHEKDGTGFDRLFAYSWKGCIEHYMQRAKAPSHATPYWKVIEASEDTLIKRREALTFERAAGRRWFCGHCTQYHHEGTSYYPTPHDFQTMIVVLEHVRTVHDIQDPVENMDFFYYVPYERPQRDLKPVVYKPKAPSPEDAPKHRYRCIRCCNDPALTKPILKLDDVVSHIVASHGLQGDALIFGVDYDFGEPSYERMYSFAY